MDSPMRICRLIQKMSRPRLYALSGVSIYKISRIERGLSIPDDLEILLLSKSLGVDPYFLRQTETQKEV
jgi:transcriptional regulator with XRE-family HTH domain